MRCFALICLLLLSDNMYAWGFFAHRKINEHAVYAVPQPLFGFYKRHADYLIKHATDADNRRYMVKEEACRHYLDGDHYEKKAPFDTLPQQYRKAAEQYTEDTLLAHGIVPWHIQAMLYRLTEAFKAKNTGQILKLSADLGHYVGDLHVPLHASSNYNGQKTGQHGIHALWESRLPELFFEGYDMLTGQVGYSPEFTQGIWTAFSESFSLADSVLSAERRISTAFPDNKKYSWEMRGQTAVKTYSAEFCRAYHEALGNMVQARMRASVRMLASMWYACWVNAGQPELDTADLPQEQEDKESAPPKGNMLGREEE